jgi:hypothetical protein
MSFEFALAKTAITGAIKSIGNLRRHFVNAKNFFSDREVDAVKRQLRIIYFQEDYLLKDIDAILLSDDRVTAMQTLARNMQESEPDARQAVETLLSDKILENLRLDATEVRELRNVADLKKGVRASVRSTLERAPSGNWSADYLNEFLDIRRTMVEINNAIDEIELVLKFRGLQVAEPQDRVRTSSQKRKSSQRGSDSARSRKRPKTTKGTSRRAKRSVSKRR